MSLHATINVERNGFALSVDMTVFDGETVAVLGPNGAGKTTLLRALAGLVRITGHVELGVKAFVDRERFVAGQAPRNEKIRELRERAASLAEGRAYLERRRLEQLVSSEVELLLSTASSDIHARLLARAGDGLPLALQAPEVSGREEEMIFHGAYLVGADERKFEAALGSLAAEYRDTGVEFELTGPWPPYNFVPEELQAS